MHSVPSPSDSKSVRRYLSVGRYACPHPTSCVGDGVVSFWTDPYRTRGGVLLGAEEARVPGCGPMGPGRDALQNRVHPLTVLSQVLPPCCLSSPGIEPFCFKSLPRPPGFCRILSIHIFKDSLQETNQLTSNKKIQTINSTPDEFETRRSFATPLPDLREEN